MDFFTNQNILLYLAAYLLSGIPFGYLLAKQFAGVDIKLRVVKEKDPVLAKKLGAATLFLDAVKGMVVIFIAMALGAPESTLWTIAVLAVLGHCFSPFLGFEGGKGVATGFGVLLDRHRCLAWRKQRTENFFTLFAHRSCSTSDRFVRSIPASSGHRITRTHMDHRHRHLLQTHSQYCTPHQKRRDKGNLI